MFQSESSSMSKLPMALDAAVSAATISEFENQMQLSLNPCLQTAGQIVRPDCLFGNLFSGVLENTSTFSPSATIRCGASSHHPSLLQKCKTESFYSHGADTSNRTEGMMGASDLGTDAVTVTAATATTTRDGSRGGAAAASTDGGDGNEADGVKQRKKRSRSKEQLDQNRIAQQKYRDRKRAEASDLQTALDQMAAQLTAFKALEQRMKDMDSTNQGLQQVVIQQMQRIRQLEGQVEEQSTTMSQQLVDLKDAVAIATRQDSMINEHQGKLHMQEQMLQQMRERLRTQASQQSDAGSGNASMRVLAAVKSAVYGLHGANGGGPYGPLDRLTPDDLVMAVSQQLLSSYPDFINQCGLGDRSL